MMIDRILVVCDGNICRSPTAAELLRHKLGEDKQVESAGLTALEGEDMDPSARQVARDRGLDCAAHAARQLTREHCRDADLILVMERRQREHLGRQFPEALGKTMLLGHWLHGREIPDPYRQERAVFETVYELLDEATDRWAGKMG